MATYFGVARRALSKMVQTEHGISRRPDGAETADIKVMIDMDAVAKIYGVAAMKNKSGRSRYMGGLVVIEVVSRKREE